MARSLFDPALGDRRNEIYFERGGGERAGGPGGTAARPWAAVLIILSGKGASHQADHMGHARSESGRHFKSDCGGWKCEF